MELTAGKQFFSGKLVRWIGIAAILFGTVTVASGAAILFFSQDARQLAGHIVPFVLWFNFVAGFFYVLAGFGIVLKRIWARPLAKVIFVATAMIATLFALFVFQDGAFEPRTVFALLFRSLFWLAVIFVLGKNRSVASY